MHEETKYLKIMLKIQDLRKQKGIKVEVRNYLPQFKPPKKYHISIDEI